MLHEVHEGEVLWVHRKGAIALPEGALGIVPGSMGAATHVVRGRGDRRAMSSCAHGAGRAIPRGMAHRTIDVRRLASELDGVVLDESKLRALVDEAPSAYKDLRAVMRAQRELVAIVATLEPGAYTAIVEGAGGGTGIAVIGVYEVDHPENGLVNISTRGKVLTGNDVMIGGFVISGSSARTVAIVATGPSLSQHGVPGPLANPTLKLVRPIFHLSCA